MNQQNFSVHFAQLVRRISARSVWKNIPLLGAFLLVLIPMPVSPWSFTEPPPESILTARGPSDEKEMEAFMDPLIKQNLREYQIPGATVSVVKDGKLFFAKGYGLADVEKQIRVDAENTLFRIGSTSKLFTWTAVMQLVEQGKLDLDRDVNDYLLEFQIPATFPQPVTLRHLMTHTAGFEEQYRGELAKDAGGLIPIGQHVARNLPARVRPPGLVTAYSNYGASLAGHIVASVSGMTYEAYVEENIFRPLGMSRSTFRQPLPANLHGDLAVGYFSSHDSLEPMPFDYLNGAPAGAMSTTAHDMARFMIAHLQDGRYGSGRILQSATAQQMHQRAFSNDPQLNGFALGFFDLNQNQQHILEHGGSLPAFHTQMALLPEQNIGIFISYNGAKGISAVGETFQAFLDHYYPTEKSQTKAPISSFAERADRLIGDYRTTRFNYTKFDRVSHLSGLGFGQVSANPDGSLSIAFAVPRGRFNSEYLEVAHLVFEEVDGPEKMIFKEDPNGNVTNLFINSMPHLAFEKIAWYETARFSQRLLIACLAIFGSVLLAFIGNLIRTHQQPDPPRVFALITSLLALVLFIGYLVNLGALNYGVPPTLKVLLGLSSALPFLAGLLVVLALLAWVHGRWGWIARVHYTLIAAAAVGFAWFLNAWNLLGFRL